MRKSQKGFSLLAVLLLILVVVLIALVGLRVVKKDIQSQSSSNSNAASKIEGYKFKLYTNTRSDRTYGYFVSITAEPSVITNGKGKYTTISASLANADIHNVTVNVDTHSEAWSLEECESSIGPLELKACSEPTASTVVELPKELVYDDKLNTVVFTIKASDKSVQYTLRKQNYLLSLADNKKALTNIQIYPTDVRVASYSQFVEECKALNPEQIRSKLKSTSVVFAETKYPGIDKVAKGQVLILSNDKNDYNTVLYKEPNGCTILPASPITNADSA
jgi:competence protein ComGC